MYLLVSDLKFVKPIMNKTSILADNDNDVIKEYFLCFLGENNY